jgi:hypothetical protein
MNPIKHVINTWLLANVFHPFLFCLQVLVMQGNVDMGLFPVVFFMGLLFSLPALFFCSTFIYSIRRLALGMSISFTLWMLLGVVSFLLCSWLVKAYFDIKPEDMTGFIPALLSSAIAVLLRLPQFENLLTSKTLPNESDLV